MWNYEKRLQFPINIKEPNAKLAQFIISQYGGPDGELGASMRYLSQRYTMPYREVAGLLTDIGTEELAHFEMIGAIVYQLTKDLSMEEIESSGFGPSISSPRICPWRKSKAPALAPTISTTPQRSGHRPQAVFRLTPVNSSPKVISSRI